MGKKPALSLRAEDCIEALRGKFKPTAYALLEQVPPGTGWKADRWADAVAMSLWPSRGLTLFGFEVKVSRSDYLRELANPKKNAAIQAYCDYWYVVTPSGLLNDTDLAEFPETWGLYEVTASKRLKVAKAAPTLEPKPFDRSFVAALFRRQAEGADAARARVREQALQEGAEKGHGALARQLKELERESKRLRAVIRDFEAASGVSIDTYLRDAKEIGDAVKIVLDAKRRRDFVDELRYKLDCHERDAKNARADLEKLAELGALRVDDAAE